MLCADSISFQSLPWRIAVLVGVQKMAVMPQKLCVVTAEESKPKEFCKRLWVTLGEGSILQ